LSIAIGGKSGGYARRLWLKEENPTAQNPHPFGPQLRCAPPGARTRNSHGKVKPRSDMHLPHAALWNKPSLAFAKGLN